MSDEVKTAKEEKKTTKTGQAVTQKYTATKQTVSVMFRQNRKFDLHIGRNMVVFKGRETKEIPREWINHIDWVNVAKYFTIKGV